jgi:hypothetical protein
LVLGLIKAPELAAKRRKKHKKQFNHG